MLTPTRPAPHLLRLDGFPWVWDGEAELLLDDVGVAPGSTCLDARCGAGSMLEPLSRRSGPGGHVVGVDPDAALVAAARRRVEDSGLTNVSLTAADALCGSGGTFTAGSFDLVHARFLLRPPGRDRAAAERLVRLARPGGTVAFQEPDATLWRSYPAATAWDRLVGAVTAAAGGAGADLTAGQRSYALLRRLGLEDVRVRTVLVALQEGHPAMRLPILLAGALREHIVGLGLLAQDDLDVILRECETIVLDPAAFVTAFLVTQVWGRTPA